MREFFKAALIRAVYTVAETAIGVIGTSAILSEVDWKMVLSASALAGIVSILKSIAVGMPEAPKENA